MKRFETGFTIVEVIIAISILGVGFLAIAAMHTSAIRANASAFNITRGITLCQNRLEGLMALPINHADLNQAGNPHQKTNPYPGYSIKWEITDGINNLSPIPNTKLIIVTVTWKEQDIDKIYQLSSVKAAL